ncbi:MAG TPA: CoA-binding protein [archaeon]|nr:CoA-binding protein [archaeon]
MGTKEGLDYFFNAKSIAVIGASREPSKVGHVVLRNLFEGGFLGKVYPVTPSAQEILGRKCHARVTDVKDSVELAIVAVKAELVASVLRDCARKKVKAAIILSSGFGEIGRTDLEKEILDIASRAKMRLLGPNCLGVFDSFTHIDSMFLPEYRLARPKEGGIAYLSQSGALGSTTLDWAAGKQIGISKFISFGNASDVGVSELLEYLGDDDKTKVIIGYIEGVKDGRKFYEAAKKVTRKKPVLILKGGTTQQGSKAAVSHTGTLAGSAKVYEGMFKQSGIIQVHSIEDLFRFARALVDQPVPSSNKVQVITDGGGYGVIAADAIAKSDSLQLAELSPQTIQELKQKMPNYAVIGNPIDLTGDADAARYQNAITAALKDPNVDSLVVILLYQVPSVSSEIVETLVETQMQSNKPMVVVSTGGGFTEVHTKYLESKGVPVFNYPEEAVRALDALSKYGAINRKNNNSHSPALQFLESKPSTEKTLKKLRTAKKKKR